MEFQPHELYSNWVIITQEPDKHMAPVAVKMEVESYDTEAPPHEAQAPSSNSQCRICLKQCNQTTLSPLFSKKRLFNRFKSLMLPYFSFNFGPHGMHVQETNTPDKICDICLNDFRNAEKFIDRVFQAEVVLRQEFNKWSQKQALVSAKVPPLSMRLRQQSDRRGGVIDTGVRERYPSESVTNCPTVDLCDLDEDPIFVPDVKVETPAPVGRSYTRKYSTRKGLVQGKMSVSCSCSNEGSGILKDPLGEDQVTEHVTAELDLSTSSHVVELPSLKQVPVAQENVEKSKVSKKLNQTFHQRRIQNLERKFGGRPQASENCSRQKTDQVDCDKKTDYAWDKYGVGQLCEQCGEILTVSRWRHYKSSSCSKWMQTCKDCGKEFRCRTHLAEHLLTHSSGDLPFACHLCSMKYKYSSNLKRHLALHEVGNANICDTCGKSFSTRHYMMVHKRIHVDPSLAKNCNYCTEKFENQQQLDRHVEDRHIDKCIDDHFAKGESLPAVLQCRFCVRKFFDPKRHSSHERSHSFAKRRKRARNANKTYVELNEQKNKQEGTKTTKGRIKRQKSSPK